jgi:thiol-disulfide isomerase/thioredoxin
MRHATRVQSIAIAAFAALVLGACSKPEPKKPAPQAAKNVPAPPPAAVTPAPTQHAAPPPTVHAPESVDLADVHSDAPGIDWFNGDVDAAFKAAKASNKPVLLYWGAKWCPPCKQLKSAVFSRPDFIEKSKLFVDVYLDGDLPDAQKYGDEFRVTGYPTVVVLKPDRTEITRIAGNMDLSLYAGVLDNALGDVRPVKDVIDLAVKGEAQMKADDCRRLAYHAFDLEDDGVFAASNLQAAFTNAVRLCPSGLDKERARFNILAAAAAAEQQKDTIEKGGKAEKDFASLILRVNGILGNQELSLANADAVRGLRPEFYRAARQTLPQIAPQLRERVMAFADASTMNPQFAPADQLAAQLVKIRVAKAYAPDGKVPTDVRSVALATAQKMLDVKMEPYVRAGVVNSAINIYAALDDWTRARDLLAQEAQTSNTPHYYLSDEGDAEEHLGNNKRALELYAEAYAKAKGPASRFQWGYDYLDALLRLSPDDTATIERVGVQVMSELDGPNRIHRRTLSRLTKLDKALREWDSTPARAAVVNKLRGTVARTCTKAANDSASQAGCQSFSAITARA